MKITRKQLRQIIKMELKEGFRPASSMRRNPFENNPEATKKLTAKVKQVAGTQLQDLIDWFEKGQVGDGFKFKMPYLEATRDLDYDTAMMFVGTGGFSASSDMLISLAKHLAALPSTADDDPDTNNDGVLDPEEISVMVRKIKEDL